MTEFIYGLCCVFIIFLSIVFYRRFIKWRLKFIGINTKGEKVINKCGMHDSMIVIFKGVKNESSDIL